MEIVEIVEEFDKELKLIEKCRLPISKEKISQMSVTAVLAVQEYKQIVYSVEKYISKYILPALYVIDSIIHASRATFGSDKDVYAPRFSLHLEAIFKRIFLDCLKEDKPKIVRLLNLWQQKSIFSIQVIQPLFSMIQSNSLQREQNIISSRDLAPQIVCKESNLSLLTDIADNKHKIPLPDQPKKLETLKSIKVEQHLHDHNVMDSIFVESNLEKKMEQSNSSIEKDYLLDKYMQTSNNLMHSGGVISKSSQIDRCPENRFCKSTILPDSSLQEPLCNAVPRLSTKRSLESDEVVYYGNGNKAKMNKLGRFSSTIKQSEVSVPKEAKHLPQSNEQLTNSSSFKEPFNDFQNQKPFYTNEEKEEGEYEDDQDDSVEQKYDFAHAPENRNNLTIQKDLHTTGSDRRQHGWCQEQIPIEELIVFPPPMPDHLTICSRTLWIGQLPPEINKSELDRMFSSFGQVVHTYIKRGSWLNCAYVGFDTRENAAKAYVHLRNRPIINGINIRLGWATGHGLMNGNFREYFVKTTGCSFIPYDRLNGNIRLGVLQEGGEIDLATVPDWLKEPNIVRPEVSNGQKVDQLYNGALQFPHFNLPQMLASMVNYPLMQPGGSFIQQPSGDWADSAEPFDMLLQGMHLPSRMATNSQPMPRKAFPRRQASHSNNQ